MKYNEEWKEDALMLEQKLYTVADVAEITGLTSRTIRNYLRDGILHGRKIGVQWRFTEQDIEKLFSETGCSQDMTMSQADLVSEFTENEDKQTKESCLIMDIPYLTEEQTQEYTNEVQQILDVLKIEDMQFAYEYFGEDKVLRMVLKGRTEDVQKAMTRIEKGFKEDEKR